MQHPLEDPNILWDTLRPVRSLVKNNVSSALAKGNFSLRQCVRGSLLYSGIGGSPNTQLPMYFRPSSFLQIKKRGVGTIFLKRLY